MAAFGEEGLEMKIMFSLRIDSEVKEKLAMLAELEGRSMTNMIERLVNQEAERRKSDEKSRQS